ncbi:MAG: AsnC family transcriptional regulator [Parcubacteria group bacterium Gr01-1014_33]|nr:MAG: AsnC family transcriptional regulator [Parcubacteria group bacterium Gr01-1014_33]
MKFSRKTDYGVILMEALKPSFRMKEFVSLASIAEKYHLPLAFLEKIAEKLRKEGFIEAKRGTDGGYRLIRNPKEITLKELIDVFEEPKMMRCMKSPHPEKHCALAKVCPTKKTWNSVEQKVMRIFERITLSEI